MPSTFPEKNRFYFRECLYNFIFFFNKNRSFLAKSRPTSAKWLISYINHVVKVLHNFRNRQVCDFCDGKPGIFLRKQSRRFVKSERFNCPNYATLKKILWSISNFILIMLEVPRANYKRII